jgi:hypothetical protein
MTEHAVGHGPSDESGASHVSIPRIVAVALLTGAGLFAMFYWIVTFDWLAFGAGIVTLVSGAVLMFVPRATGADRAA